MPRALLPEDLLDHATWMRGLARSLVRDDASADDVVQEAFAAVAERPTHRPAVLGAWLRGLIGNLSRRSRRTEQRARRREERFARPEKDVASPLELLERAELHRQVVDEVIALPEPYRSAVLLRYFDDLSPAEIAQRESVPVATVRTWLHRGLEKLRQSFDHAHGARAAWCVLLAPLATSRSAVEGAVTGAGIAEGASAPILAGGGSAAVGAKTILLGGIFVSQKLALTVAGISVAVLAVGLGVGVLAGRSTQEAEVARQRVLAESRTNALEKELAQAKADLEREIAARMGFEKEKDGLATRLTGLEAELRAERAERAQASAEPEKGHTLPVSFGEFADLDGLKEADWPELAEALKTMNGLFVDLLEKVEKGEPLDPDVQKKIAAENAKLVKLAAQVMGKLPTHSLVNGEFTHPIVLANLLGAMLQESGLSLDAKQAAALAKFGGEYESLYSRKQEGYTADTPQLQKVIDELELKQDCITKMRGALSTEQRDEVLPPQIADRLQLDVLSPGVSTLLSVQQKQYPSVEEARTRFQQSLLKDLQIDAAAVPAASAAFDAYFRDVEPLLTAAPEKSIPRVPDVLLAGHAQAELFRNLLSAPGLSDASRAAILSHATWIYPVISDKAAKKE
jgi:RNA polymerase sigma factor (sigma-70 family)